MFYEFNKSELNQVAAPQPWQAVAQRLGSIPDCRDGVNTMSFLFLKVEDCDIEQYKKDMQEAFQKGFEEYFGKTEEIILPEEDINRSLTTKGAVAKIRCLVL